MPDRPREHRRERPARQGGGASAARPGARGARASGERHREQVVRHRWCSRRTRPCGHPATRRAPSRRRLSRSGARGRRARGRSRAASSVTRYRSNGPPDRSDANSSARPSGVHAGVTLRPDGDVATTVSPPRIRIDEHDLATGRRVHAARPRCDARPETIAARRTPVGLVARSSAASSNAARPASSCSRSMITSVRAPPDRWTAATRLPSGETSTSVSRAPFVRRRTAPVRRSSRYTSARERDVAPDLELIEVHAHRHSGRPALRHTAWPACRGAASVARDAVERWKPVRVAPRNTRCCRRGRSAVRTPGSRDASGAPQTARHLRLPAPPRRGGGEVAREVAPQAAERCAVHRSERGRAEVREAPGRAPRELRELLFAKPPRQIVVEVRAVRHTSPMPAGQSTSPPLTRSSGSNAPARAASATTAWKSPAARRPSPARLSSKVASPSMCQSGSVRFGNANGARPKTPRASAAHPRDRSRCRTCAYSCVNTSRNQSLVFPMASAPAGGTAVSSIRL